MNDTNFISGFLYTEDLENEKKDRLLGIDQSDYYIIDALISDINSLGYNFKYLTDLRWTNIKDKRIIPILNQYLLKFKNLGIAEDLLNLISYKGFIEATQLVLDLYEKIKTEQKKIFQCGSCDNALYNIADKRFIPKYLALLKCENDAIRLPLTMELLGKWRNEDAKKYFIKYLKSDKDQLVFVALCAVKYYKNDEECKTNVNNLVYHKNKDIVYLAKKVIKKFN